MISIDEISKYYPEKLHSFKNFILREYLQYKILEIVFESEFGKQLSFLGGTCLRIVHNNNRFSEDLDFDNFNLSVNDFAGISEVIGKQLQKQGYQVEIKNVFRDAFHCYIRFPKLLFNHRLTGHAEQKILIQLDTEPHNFSYTPEAHIINKFDVFTQIKITPSDILLAQKFFALLNRKRKKGRDFYDIIFLLRQTHANYDYLKQKTGISTPEELKKSVLDVCSKTNLDQMAKDVEPFLFNPSDTKYITLFPEYIKQVI
ncbi:MAG: nucleotidyl transferase AbiEii/AbiGii toxin family protein [Bacteroidales bacterium]|nr:nucleotidyl transferase AbiEii/AbiGii toxin family protein [Bacteroidales bacterium]